MLYVLILSANSEQSCVY